MIDNLRTFTSIALALLGLNSPAQSQDDGPRDVRELERFTDSLFSASMTRARIPGAAFCFVKDGRVFLCKGYGVANVRERRAVSAESTVFRIGSISKVMTATALVQLADRGAIDLDADVNRYLQRVRVPATFPEPVTARQLLNHTAGFDEIRPGTQAPTAAGVLPLAEFLRPRLVRVRGAGHTISYSTYGVTLAGLLIEEISKVPYEEYLTREVWRPLGMLRTNVTVPASLARDVAMGYEIAADTAVPQRWEWYHTTPASSVNSTAADMARFMIAHLDEGKLGDARVLSDRAARYMQRQHVTMHPRLPGFALGFYEDYVGQLRVLEHGGNMEGFSSLMVLLPDQRSGFFVVNHLEGSTLRDELKETLLTRYYSRARQRLPVPARPLGFSQRIAEYTGRYGPTTSCHSCAPRSVPYVMTVSASPDSSGLLMSGKQWIEVERSLFVRQDGTGYIAFRRDAGGKVTEMFAGGFWSFERLP